MSPRAGFVLLDQIEPRLRATMPYTHHGLVRVEWLEVAGDRCWFSSGTGDAKREAVPAIEHIEAMCQSAR